MKKLSLWFMTVLVMCLSFICVAFSSCNPTKDEIKLNETAITLEVGASQTLTATTNVKTGVKWSTSDDSIATVDDGVVNAISVGTATITATAGKATATCTVTVNAAREYAELVVDKTTVELREGGRSVSVTATFTVDDEARTCEFVWTSEDDTVATVEDGNIAPVGVGSTVVTVSVEYKGETYLAEVEVVVKPDEQIQVSKGTIQLALAAIDGAITSDTFTATAYKAGVENTEVTLEFVSSNEEVATVTAAEGVATVTSVSEGNCTISIFYTSTKGKIETTVNVIVTRSTLVLDEVIEINYVEGNTVLDISDLELQGSLEGVYYAGEKVGAEDGILNTAFVEKNKGIIIPIEVHTNIAIYETELLIVIPFKAEPKQEKAATELVDMPTFDGDPTTLGFPAGTETAYELVIDSENGKDGWTNRMITNAANDKDVFVFDVIAKEMASSSFLFTVWPAKNILETQGSYSVSAASTAPGDGADPSRKIFVLDAEDRRPSTFTEGTLYTIYVFLNKGETHVHFSTFTNGTVYVANIRCLSADEIENDPTIIPPISQGEGHNKMPVFEGDVTELGFAEGTTVYPIVGPQSNANDVKLVAQVDSSGDNMYAKLDFVLSAPTASLGLWITAETTHLGYYTITPTGITADSLGDPSREIFVTNASGEKVQSFEADTMYTLYIRLDGREVSIQFTTWAGLTIYAANVGCITEDELPFEPTLPPVTQGKEISILFIGNSFSDDTETYMVDILLNLGYTNINIGNLYIGGCSIDTHYANIMSGNSAYDFRMRSHNGRKYTEYVRTTVGGIKQSMAFAIAYKAWDIISVQQASGDSGKADTYSNLSALVEEVQNKATNPDVQFVFNMTWAYQADSTHAQFPDYNSNQMTMYNAIVSAVQSKVNYTVVPNGTAIQNARTSFIGDKLTRDGYHLDLNIGCYIAGLTFVAKVTGADITNFAYAPNGVTKAQHEVAIESVKNALATPFAVTESQIKKDPYAIDADSPITAGGSNTDAVTNYNGNVEELGFAAGSEVFKYVGVDSVADKVAIKVDSTNYDYVEVQFVIASGDGFFWMHGRKGGNFYKNGVGYVIDPSWIRLGDGNNSPSDRRIEIFDTDGNKVTSLMKNNVLYTLRVFTKVGELDEILISQSNATIYLANVTQGLEADLPQPPVEGPIKQGDAQAALPTYTGDVTAFGFEEGALVQYMVTETSSNVWAADPISGKTREQLAAKIPGQVGKYVTIKFAVSKDVAGDSVFYVWGLLNSNHTVNGAVNFTTTNYGRILDVDGNLVTSLSKDTIYVLELYMEGTDTYNVANIFATGMELYFDADSITYSDDSIVVKPEGVLDPDGPVTAGGSNVEAVKEYDGDVTALGFAEGTTVYKYVGVDSVADKVAIKVDSTNYDYVEVQFIIASGDGFFWMHGRKGGNFYKNGVGYVIDPSWIRLGDSNNSPSDRRIEIFDADGNKVTSLMENNVLYTLRVFTKVGELDEILISQSNETIYLANIKQGLEADLPKPEPQAPIVSGETTSTGLTVYDGDVTALGFAADTTVYQLVSASVWDDRVKIATDPNYKYLDVEFIVSSGDWYFLIWLCNANGMLDGNYLVGEMGGGTQHATYGDGFAQHTPNAGTAGGNTRIQVLDADGNVVIGNRPNGTLYTLRVWLADESVTEVQIGNNSGTMYFGNIACTDADTETPDVPDPEPVGPTAVDIKIGDNKADPTLFDGEETMYGFADGTEVVVVGLEAVTDVDDKRLALIVDPKKNYLAIEFALEFGLFGNIYVWTVTDGGERVLAATILAEGGVEAGALVDIVIKDSKGTNVTSDVLVGLDSGAAEKYTLYVYYNGADEVHIGCDDYDEEFGGNILYFANAECRSDDE